MTSITVSFERSDAIDDTVGVGEGFVDDRAGVVDVDEYVCAYFSIEYFKCFLAFSSSNLLSAAKPKSVINATVFLYDSNLIFPALPPAVLPVHVIDARNSFVIMPVTIFARTFLPSALPLAPPILLRTVT